jgi:hypothetical protein
MVLFLALCTADSMIYRYHQNTRNNQPQTHFMQFKKDEILFLDIRFLAGIGMVVVALLAMALNYQSAI